MNSKDLSENLIQNGYAITNKQIIEEWRKLEYHFIDRREYVGCDLHINDDESVMLTNISATLLVMLLFRFNVNIDHFEMII